MDQNQLTPRTWTHSSTSAVEWTLVRSSTMQNIVTVGKVYRKSTYGDADRNVLGGKSKSICRTCIYSSEKTSSPSPWWKRSNIINHQQMAGWLPQRTEAYRALHVGLCIWQIRHSAVTSASLVIVATTFLLLKPSIVFNPANMATFSWALWTSSRWLQKEADWWPLCHLFCAHTGKSPLQQMRFGEHSHSGDRQRYTHEPCS